MTRTLPLAAPATGDFETVATAYNEVKQSLAANPKRWLITGVAGFCYGLGAVGLRYFNVFGPRQNVNGPYAAVIPAWFKGLIEDRDLFINGDGETSRDFCYVANAVQANLLAAFTTSEEAIGQVYNIACSKRTTLNELFAGIRERVAASFPQASGRKPDYREFRTGDVRHSLADIGKARRLLGYVPSHQMPEGLDETAGWFIQNLSAAPSDG